MTLKQLKEMLVQIDVPDDIEVLIDDNTYNHNIHSAQGIAVELDSASDTQAVIIYAV